MRTLLIALSALFVVGCHAPCAGTDMEEMEETPTQICDLTKDLNKDGCNDAICVTLLQEGDELNGVPLSEDLVIETRYFGSCADPQDLVLDPSCSSDLEVTEGDGCSSVTCQLPSGSATYKCE